ncbi:MAG: hypothetical protein AAFW46_03435 [Pseudomonadota bacterium]
MGWRRAALLAALATTLGAQPALAGMCDVKVFRSQLGEKRVEANGEFKTNEQFQVCFQVTQTGFVTLWDQIPTDGPIERLVPGPYFSGEGSRAAKVVAGAVRCFGDGSDGYYLAMDPDDGVGTGKMWLVFTDAEENHPDETSFNSNEDIAAKFQRFGAGSVRALSPTEAEEAPQNCDEPLTTRNYYYGVR